MGTHMSIEVSVIIPTYNRAGLIPFTLDSILRQSHKPSEVIVVDDGSKDDTEAVVRQYASRVKYVRVENGGQGRARNIGVSAATTPWIAFCDSDDLWQPDKLALQVRLFERAPDVQYAFTNFRTVMDNRWSTATKFDTSPPGYWNVPHREIDKDLFVIDVPMFDRLLRHQPIFPSTVMMRRSFYDALGRWNESLRHIPVEDLEFNLRCAAHARIGVVSAPVVGIRKHNSNFSSDALGALLGEIEILRYVLANHPGAKSHAWAIEEQIVVRSARAAEAAFAAGELQKTRQLLEAVPYGRRTWRQHLKAVIVHCPSRLARFLQKQTVALQRALAHESGSTA